GGRQLSIEPRRDFVHPARGVFSQSLAAEVHTLAAAVTEIAGERVAVRAFQSNSGFPKCLLRGADVGRTGVVGCMITYLRHKPRKHPSHFAACLADELFQ